MKNRNSTNSEKYKEIHKNFVQLGRERNRITYKLLALLPKINELKIYEREGYANIYDYAARIAGLSSGVVKKALKLEEKLCNMPHLQKTIETQGVNKVGIVVGLATKENEKDLAEKVENMSKPALQEYSKEVRGKLTTSWQVELDEKMMFVFLKLKKKFGKNLSNKECLRRILELMEMQITGASGTRKIFGENRGKRTKIAKIPGENVRIEIPRGKKMGVIGYAKIVKIPGENVRIENVEGSEVEEKCECCEGAWGSEVRIENVDGSERKEELGKSAVKSTVKITKSTKITRYIPVQKRKILSEQCSHPGCHRPAEIIHHTNRFSEYQNHENLKPLCKYHHEFAHNGVSEPMQLADYKYREHRQAALL